ncbi:MAG: amidohydrolase family protein [Micrococcales bacterium]|nr:amidohydrolase family protein [Micrococcales bacterium]
MPTRTDIHQHLWPAELIDALRRRQRTPLLKGWTLLLDGEAPVEIDAHAHDQGARSARSSSERPGERALVSLSSPVGIEHLDGDESHPLLEAWRAGTATLPPPFSAWAAVSVVEPDLTALAVDLAVGFVGLQIPATAMATPAQLEQLAPVLEVCAAANRPVLVHPGPAGPLPVSPRWWPPVVDYVSQLHAAWWSWHAVGRTVLPTLRICFVALAGLAPLHHERLAARGGRLGPVDPGVFLETSSYGPQAIDAVSRALGIDAIVLGSDRPYAEPVDPRGLRLGDAAAAAIERNNPRRLLEGSLR